MSNKGELAAVMAKRLAKTQEEQSQEGNDESQPSHIPDEYGSSSYRRETAETFSPSSGSAKNFFKEREKELMTKRLSLDQEELMRKDREDARKELQEKADKRKAFLERMAVFNSKK